MRYENENSGRSIGIALAGMGTVGKGFLKLFAKRKSELEQRLGAHLELRWIVDRHPKGKAKGLSTGGAKITQRVEPVLNDPDVDIVIELIGGKKEAKELVLGALNSGKHVITANKLLLATSWEQVFAASSKGNRHVFFEAAVASAIPIIRSIREGLASSRLTGIRAILNGTTNYILTQMIHGGMDYKKALKQAQAKGFAEANPKLDVNGTDTAHKLSILTSLAAGRWVNPKDIYTEGIQEVESEDIHFAQEHLGLTARLLGIFEMETGSPSTALRASVRVHPCLFSIDHPFATVHDEYNAIWLETDAAGDLYFLGKGAGGVPAASAVLSDLADLSRLILSQAPVSAPSNAQGFRMKHMREVSHSYYLRLWAKDKPGVLGKITGILGANKISIAQIYQGDSTGFETKKSGAPVIVVTHPGAEGSMQKVLKALHKSPDTEIAAFLRILQ